MRWATYGWGFASGVWFIVGVGYLLYGMTPGRMYSERAALIKERDLYRSAFCTAAEEFGNGVDDAPEACPPGEWRNLYEDVGR